MKPPTHLEPRDYVLQPPTQKELDDIRTNPKRRDYAKHPLTQKELDDIRRSSDDFYRRMCERDNAWMCHPDNRTVSRIFVVVCLVEGAIGLVCWLYRLYH